MPWPSLAAVIIGLFCQPSSRVCEYVRVRADAGDFAGLGGEAITASTLRAGGLTSSAMVARARAMAGAPFESDTVFVNGLAATSLPPGHLIATVAVNDDVFSAQWADAGANRLDITTASADRALRWTAAGVLPTRSGSARADAPRRRAWSPQLQISGPVPFLPLTFQAAVEVERSRVDVPTSAAVVGAASLPLSVFEPVQSGHVEHDNRHDVFATIASTPSAARRVAVSLSDSRWHSTNMSPAPLAQDSARAALQGHVSMAGVRVDIVRARVNERHLLSVADAGTSSLGDASSLALSVLDMADLGGAADLATRMRTRTITSKHVWEGLAGRRRWLAGIDLSIAETTSVTEPNPNGRLVFGTRQAYLDTVAGASNGTWLWSAGTVTREATRRALAVFAEQVLFSGARSVLRGGVRVDGEAGAGVRLLPRLSATWRSGGWTVRAGAGQFLAETDTATRAFASPAASSSLPQFLGLRASIEPSPSAGNLRLLESRLDPGLRRRDALMTRVGIERSGLRGAVGLEHIWLHSRHAAVVRRQDLGDRFVDLLQSDRKTDRQQFLVRLRGRVGRASFFANGTYVIARDDMSGWGQTPYEWGQTPGVSRCSLAWGVDTRLPGAIDLSLFATRRGGAAYDIRTGVDVRENGMFEDRGGLSPNSGVGPRFSSIDVTLQRRMRLPLGALPSATIGLRASNVLDSDNVLRYGSVVNSPLFGRPVGAMPGRSASVSVTFGR